MSEPSIHCLSLSHRLVPDAVLGRLAFSTDAIQDALRAARRDPHIERLTILSTCHRVELYAAMPPGTLDARARLVAWLAQQRGIAPRIVDEHACYAHGVAAVRHLCRVACGLEASILGERQVLSQVVSALRHGVAAHSVDPLLKDVFRTAVCSAEHVHRSVWAAFRAADIGMAAASGADEALDGLTGRTAAVVGAGDVAELSLNALRARGVARLTVVNRTRDRAAPLAKQHGAETAPLEDLSDVVRHADVVVVATRAAGVILGAPVVRRALAGRPDRTLVIVDTALPRNVDPDIRLLAGATLLDLDDLRPQFARVSHERRDGVTAVEALIELEVNAWYARRQHRIGGGALPASPGHSSRGRALA